MDGKVNQFLLMGLVKNIVQPLNDIVEWDRYGFRHEDDSGFIFGWIKRDDNFYDFLVVRFWLDWNRGGPQFFCSYDTSSKKYSKEIGVRLGSNLEGYVECKSAKDIPSANLVSWQKKIGVMLSISIITMLLLNVFNGAITGGFNLLNLLNGAVPSMNKTKAGKHSMMEEMRNQANAIVGALAHQMSAGRSLNATLSY